MTDTLGWRIDGWVFEDNSRFRDWRKIHEHPTWMWQYDTHELSFDIYEHDGQFWKLYRIRYAENDASGYVTGFGGQACRVVLARYRVKAKSPHSKMLFEAGDEEWVRTYEVDPRIHEVIKAGAASAKYGDPYGSGAAA